MRLIDIIDHKNLSISKIWVTSYYDYPLEGYCWYNSRRHYFICIESDNELEEGSTHFEKLYYYIYELDFIEYVKSIIDQKLFEICVGYHYTFKNGSRLGDYHLKSPEWFWKIVQTIYYKI